MRIAHSPTLLVAVLHLAVFLMSVSGRVPSNTSFAPERFRHQRNTKLEWSQNLTLREKQLYILQQSLDTEDQDVACCPSVVEMTEPESGKNEQGMLVKLYRDAGNRQRFYEISCKPEVENKECKFVDKKLANQSRCTQQYSFSYALLEDERDGEGSMANFPIMGYTPGRTKWMLGYIKVRSGCACTLSPKKAKKSKPSKTRKRQHHDDGLT